jgi:NAD(P)-dependent dehydrogenase (short-subunit alcohol dehydrogenase family)
MSKKDQRSRSHRDEASGVRQPKPPFKEQHQRSPGLESKLDPEPKFRAETYRPAGKLKDKAALITGGDSGIGRAVALMFAREGASVAINYLEIEQSDAEKTGATCCLIPGDLTENGFCERLVDKAVEELGKLDILVSNAAHQERKSDLEEVSDEEIERTFATNIFAYMRLARAAVPRMKPGGAIIATSSETGLFGSEKLPDYSATKGAINAFTKTLAQSLIDKGIRVNAVAPGPVWTPLNPADQAPDKISNFGGDTSYRRPAQPEEMSPAYVFLASSVCSSYITGVVLPATGYVGE